MAEFATSATTIDITNCLPIIQEAGRQVMEIYHDQEGGYEVSEKSDHSPLTKADRAAHKAICDRLKNHYPDIPIISEEQQEISYETRKGYEAFWLVDPLDGTKEFIKQNGEFTLNLALVYQGKPIAGIVAAPALERIYYAQQNAGAYLWDEHDQTHQLSVNRFSHADPGLRLVCSRSHMNEDTQAFVDQYKNPELVSMGSSLKFMLVAEGKADIYPRFGPTMEWDTGAAQAIVETAGGQVIANETQKPLEYNKPDLHNPWFLVYGNPTDANA